MFPKENWSTKIVSDFDWSQMQLEFVVVHGTILPKLWCNIPKSLIKQYILNTYFNDFFFIDVVPVIHETIWEAHVQQLIPCGRCGRTFFPDRIKVCYFWGENTLNFTFNKDFIFLEPHGYSRGCQIENTGPQPFSEWHGICTFDEPTGRTKYVSWASYYSAFLPLCTSDSQNWGHSGIHNRLIDTS